ncbi:MAG: DUF2147 domain-containing protein [Sphingomonas sp.]|nr:DUF2147 domain-containing protein [Sphingomonas sp.]
MTMRSKMATALACATVWAAPAAAQNDVPRGTWSNPAGSVHVVFRGCDDAICGKVTWASRAARADAARGGSEPLVGLTLFDHFVPEERGRWHGAVLVPDIGKRVSGTITLVNARTLVGEGCLFAGFGCKSQTWTRIR